MNCWKWQTQIIDNDWKRFPVILKIDENREMIKQGKRTISCQERQGYANRDCEWRMCTNSWNRERPFDGRSEDKRSMQWRWRTNGNVFISMQMRVCDASRVKKKRYNRWREIADTLMICTMSGDKEESGN